MKKDKKFVLSHLFTLPKEEILDIYNIINGYKERVNKSAKDTLLARCVFINGYHKTSEFYKIIIEEKKDFYQASIANRAPEREFIPAAVY